MTDSPKPKQKALCVATRCTNVDQFVTTFHRFCDDSTFFVATLATRPVGLETAFSIQLEDKTPVLRGLCSVVEAWSTPANRFGRPGVRLAVKRLTNDSLVVFRQLQSARKAAEAAEAAGTPEPPVPTGQIPVVDTTPPPTMPIATATIPSSPDTAAAFATLKLTALAPAPAAPIAAAATKAAEAAKPEPSGAPTSANAKSPDAATTAKAAPPTTAKPDAATTAKPADVGPAAKPVDPKPTEAKPLSRPVPTPPKLPPLRPISSATPPAFPVFPTPAGAPPPLPSLRADATPLPSVRPDASAPTGASTNGTGSSPTGARSDATPPPSPPSGANGTGPAPSTRSNAPATGSSPPSARSDATPPPSSPSGANGAGSTPMSARSDVRTDATPPPSPPSAVNGTAPMSARSNAPATTGSSPPSARSDATPPPSSPSGANAAGSTPMSARSDARTDATPPPSSPSPSPTNAATNPAPGTGSTSPWSDTTATYGAAGSSPTSDAAAGASPGSTATSARTDAATAPAPDARPASPWSDTTATYDSPGASARAASEPGAIHDSPPPRDYVPEPIAASDDLTNPVASETRTPGSSFILPANPLMNLTDKSLEGFVDCALYEETGNFFRAPGYEESLVDIDDVIAAPPQPARPAPRTLSPVAALLPNAFVPAGENQDFAPEITPLPQLAGIVPLRAETDPPIPPTPRAGRAPTPPVYDQALGMFYAPASDDETGVGLRPPPTAPPPLGPPPVQPMAMQPMHARPTPTPPLDSTAALIAVNQQRARKRWLVIGAAAAAASLLLLIIVLASTGDRGSKTADAATPTTKDPVTGVPKAAADPVATKPEVTEPAVAKTTVPKPEVAKPEVVEADPEVDPVGDPNAPPLVGIGPCRVTVNSSPAGSMVSIDDQQVGPSPITIAGPCAKRRVDVKHPRYTIGTKWVTPTAGKPANVDLALSRPTHSVTVTSSPSGATVSIAGRRAGTTPTAVKVMGFTGVTLTVEKKGYRTETQKLYSKSDGERLTIKLVKGK